FLDTGTQLAFRPFISNEGIIRLEIAPRVSEGVVNTRTDVSGVAITVPDEITQELNTNIAVPDGATVVLGGLFKETTSASRSQVPIFGDLPLIGAAFRGHDDSIDRQEVIFMLTPTIMNDTVMMAQGERGMQWTERVRVGSRNGTLPFSRERQTAQLNVQAERLAREGEYDRAMHVLRRSLELNPHQTDALYLREQLMNQTDFWPKRSIIGTIINDEVGVRFQAPPKPANDTDPSPLGKNDRSGFSGEEQTTPKVAGTSKPAEVSNPEPGKTVAEVLADDSSSFGTDTGLQNRTYSKSGDLAPLQGDTTGQVSSGGSRFSDPVTAELDAYLAELRNQTSPFAEVEGFSEHGSFSPAKPEPMPTLVDADRQTQTTPFSPGQGPLAYFPAIWNLPMSFFKPEFWSQHAERSEPAAESETEITTVDIELDN
ncbi:MAG: hypothetical protein ACNA8P_02550, partial [Phycisphaerales bacterium]